MASGLFLVLPESSLWFGLCAVSRSRFGTRLRECDAAVQRSISVAVVSPAVHYLWDEFSIRDWSHFFHGSIATDSGMRVRPLSSNRAGSPCV